jgi:hypothetical protein
MVSVSFSRLVARGYFQISRNLFFLDPYLSFRMILSLSILYKFWTVLYSLRISNWIKESYLIHAPAALAPERDTPPGNHSGCPASSHSTD